MLALIVCEGKRMQAAEGEKQWIELSRSKASELQRPTWQDGPS